MKAILRTDGGARGNPGPAAAGFVLEDLDGRAVAEGARYIGETTNNVAEYEALLLGLRCALDRGVTDVHVYSDSELLVRQMNGVYRVKHANMKPLFASARELGARFDRFVVEHVPRERNTEADRLANEALDLRGDVGDVEFESGFGDQGCLF